VYWQNQKRKECYGENNSPFILSVQRVGRAPGGFLAGRIIQFNYCFCQHIQENSGTYLLDAQGNCLFQGIVFS
jgi:hypothetical protein